MAVRDYLNGGGKLAHTGETTAYYGALGAALGGIYCGLNGAPDQDCVITDDFFSDCLLLADDFTQYYLGAFNRTRREEPTALEGISPPFGGSTADFDPRASNPSDRGGHLPPDQRRAAARAVSAVRQPGVEQVRRRTPVDGRDIPG